MDDLLGEDWQGPAKRTTASQIAPSPLPSIYAPLRPSPQPQSTSSALSSPQSLSRPSSIVNGNKSRTSDTFSNLLASSKAQKSGASLSIQERQKQLLEEKGRQQTQHAQLWDSLGGGRGTPALWQPSPAQGLGKDDEDDVLAAFNNAAPMDNASYYPPPGSGAISGRSTSAAGLNGVKGSANNHISLEDDDPFGLGAAPQKSNGNGTHSSKVRQHDNGDDDILGDLAKPMTAQGPHTLSSTTNKELDTEDEDEEEGPVSADIRPPKSRADEGALAELIEMGFQPEPAKIALEESKGDVQGAVGWLLQHAHEESRQKASQEIGVRRRSPSTVSRSPLRRRSNAPDVTWMRQPEPSALSAKPQGRNSPANGDGNTTQAAQELSSKLLKSANSLWKASQKQMAKTMAEFQSERDPAQPKWMQESSAESSRASSQRRSETRPAPKRAPDVTDEAAMLDAPRTERPPKPPRPVTIERLPDSPARGRSPANALPIRPATQPKFMQQVPPDHDRRPASKISRQDVEDQTAQAYISPARRKRPIPKSQPAAEPDVDLFGSAPTVKPVERATTAATPRQPTPAAPTPRQPPMIQASKLAPRTIPTVSSSALSISAQHRKMGGEAFTRGDYAAAHVHYTSALAPLPPTHPIAIMILSNRALTALKTGDAKAAVADADSAINLIGPANGTDETIDLGAGEGTKQMRDFYGKALMRKAEALEHLERWTDAAAVWRDAIQAGVGGAVSLRGRDRCEKAASPNPVNAAVASGVVSKAPAPKGRSAPPPRSLRDSLHRPTLTSPVSAAAVQKLRAANAAAERVDDEKFALTDVVDARLTTWRGGKAENLRALLQSLDAVLWEGAGWKKVGMSDLVLPGKVKVVYMRAIGKVHPDKISQEATTEQRMISAAVFSTLNEAWDKFKTDNGL